MSKRITTLGLDADDTLWHNETFFKLTQERFAELLKDHADPVDLDARLLAAERRNIGHYGFGIKGFMLSMIETALEVTEDHASGDIIAEILAAGKEMLSHPINLLPGVQETVETLAKDYSLVLITKGDLLDQERKLAQSGLGELFDAVDIVSNKIPEIYTQAFENYGNGAARALMVGNSVKSDILPALEAGAFAAHVPFDLVWDLEKAELPTENPRFSELKTISEILPLLDRLNA